MSGPAKHSGRESVVVERRDGSMLRVRVKPRSRRKGVLGVTGTELSVAVGAPPEKGRANAEAVEIIATWLGLPASRLSVSSGAGSRSKRVAVAGIDAAGLRRMIAERLGRNRP